MTAISIAPRRTVKAILLTCIPLAALLAGGLAAWASGSPGRLFGSSPVPDGSSPLA